MGIKDDDSSQEARSHIHYNEKATAGEMSDAFEELLDESLREMDIDPKELEELPREPGSRGSFNEGATAQDACDAVGELLDSYLIRIGKNPKDYEGVSEGFSEREPG